MNPDIINIIIAILLTIVTTVLGMFGLHLIFKAKNKHKKKEEPIPDDSRKIRCELNEIMGYDFIKIEDCSDHKETNIIEEVSTYNPKNSVSSYAESRGLGTNQIPVSTTSETTSRIVVNTEQETETTVPERPEKPERDDVADNRLYDYYSESSKVEKDARDEVDSMISHHYGEWSSSQRYSHKIEMPEKNDSSSESNPVDKTNETSTLPGSNPTEQSNETLEDVPDTTTLDDFDGDDYAEDELSVLENMFKEPKESKEEPKVDKQPEVELSQEFIEEQQALEESFQAALFECSQTDINEEDALFKLEENLNRINKEAADELYNPIQDLSPDDDTE